MQYRRLGRSGLQLSELSLGSWVTYHNQVDTKAAKEMLATDKDAGALTSLTTPKPTRKAKAKWSWVKPSKP